MDDPTVDVAAPPTEEPKKLALRLGTTRRRLDPQALKDGVREECPFRPGFFVSVLPAAMFSPAYKKAVARSWEDDNFKARYDNPEFVRDALVAGMDGISDADGVAVPYTPEVGLVVLADEGNIDVREWVVGAALEFSKFYLVQLEADAKN